MDDDARAARAAARASWPIASGHAPARACDTTPEERLATMWQLAVDAWAASGRALPTYTRADMPGRIVRKGAPRG
jgi:hypothetical protein